MMNSVGSLMGQLKDESGAAACDNIERGPNITMPRQEGASAYGGVVTEEDERYVKIK